jgi:hypothetical protein
MPRLAITFDQNTLYIGESNISPQQIYRFDITTDTPDQTAKAPHGPVTVNTLCVMPDGKVVSSYEQVWSADLSTLLFTLPVGGVEIECSGSFNKVYISNEKTLSIFTLDASSYSKAVNINLGDSVGVARVNGAETRLYIGTTGGVKELGTEGSSAYLPLTMKPLPGIHGRVTYIGTSAGGVPLELLFYDGAMWSSIAATTTDSEGRYWFAGASALVPGQKYYVRYYNSAGTGGRLWVWNTRVLTSYTAGSSVKIGDFDITDIDLLSPASGSTVGLPFTFQWRPRPATPSDTYEFDLYDPTDGNPYFYTAPPLGYVGSYTLNGLPSGFNPGVPYVWEIWVYDPDGGFGISYQSPSVTFSNAGSGTLVTPSPLFHRLPRYQESLPDR